MDFAVYLINDYGKWETALIPEELRQDFLDLLYACRKEGLRGVPVGEFRKWLAKKTKA